MNKKTLIIIRGLSGSGKTTLANLICSDFSDRSSVCADDFFTDQNGNYNFNAERLKDAHEWCQTQVLEMMEDDFEIIVVHNTFTRKWEVDPYVEIAKNNHYQIQVINLFDSGLSDRELSQRCVHGVSQKNINTQRKRWEREVLREKRDYRNEHPPYPYHYPYPPMMHPPHPYPAMMFQGRNPKSK